MKHTFSLNGLWNLYYYDPDRIFIETGEGRAVPDLYGLFKKGDISMITARVPGNAEPELFSAGVISGDLFKGMATRENEKWESFDWWYERTFTLPEKFTGKEQVWLSFSGVDCFARYYVNGQQVYASENAFTDHIFDVTKALIAGENRLSVHIRSTVREASLKEYTRAAVGGKSLQAHVRKPAHSFGWDIFPRAVSAGLTKDVSLILTDGVFIRDVSCHTAKASKDRAKLVFTVDVSAPYSLLKGQLQVRFKGKCGDSFFAGERTVKNSRVFRFDVEIEKPRLWWPSGYGDANIYDTVFELVSAGEIIDRRDIAVGIRTVKLERTESLLEKDHCFRFVINGVPVLLNGSNWVPLSPYHSMDKDRYMKVLPFFTDTHSNIVRVWGGGVYEQEIFYDYCDRHGICVWQDFMMACIRVDQDEETLKNLREEFTWAVKKLRNHPSLILWAGDNEIDESMAFAGEDSAGNIITRKLLPEILAMEDPYRDYLPSSPYIPSGFSEKYQKQEDVFVERHLWGARDYYKADFYRNSKAHFVSECGYQGCPQVSTIKKFVNPDKVWPIFNEEWTLHSADQEDSPHRVQLTWDQVRQLFAFEPENLEDFSLASQISQAEAKKFFIERIRIRKPYTSGIIWWNMMDGWPQLSDAVVDFFFEKKLAYEYIKRSQLPVCLMLDEMHDWNYEVFACNDTLERAAGSYEVFDIDTKEVLSAGEFSLKENETKPVGKVRLFYSDKKFLVIKFTVNGKTYYNHYLAGPVPFDFDAYKNWLLQFDEILKG